MSTTLSLLDLIERPSILDPETGSGDHGRAADRGRASPPERCEHERVRRPRVERERSDRDDQAGPAVGGATTLDDLLTGIWNELTTERPTTCPLCQGTLEPRYGAGSAPVGGRCRDCGTEMS